MLEVPSELFWYLLEAACVDKHQGYHHAHTDFVYAKDTLIYEQLLHNKWVAKFPFGTSLVSPDSGVIAAQVSDSGYSVLNQAMTVARNMPLDDLWSHKHLTGIGYIDTREEALITRGRQLLENSQDAGDRYYFKVTGLHSTDSRINFGSHLTAKGREFIKVALANYPTQIVSEMLFSHFNVGDRGVAACRELIEYIPRDSEALFLTRFSQEASQPEIVGQYQDLSHWVEVFAKLFTKRKHQ